MFPSYLHFPFCLSFWSQTVDSSVHVCNLCVCSFISVSKKSLMKHRENAHPPGHSELQIFHGVTYLKGVGHQCPGTQVAISYLCLTFQSRLQPEEAITEFKPLAFVCSHSSLMKALWNPTSNTQIPCDVCSRSCSEECEREQKERSRTLITSAE